jgi:predicted DNA-binding protein (MmcQ/YjbR family)
VAEEDFDELSERKGFKPAPYMARHKWVWVENIKLVGKKEWKQFAGRSYELVKAKLPKKKRK